jgi:hypothetical protein
MISVTVSASLDASTLSAFIAQQENFLRGVLRSIKSDGDRLILEFDDEKGDRPKVNTVVTTRTPPPGARVVGSTQLLEANIPRSAIAYRMDEIA